MADPADPARENSIVVREADDGLPGLVWAYRFDADGAARALTGREAGEAASADDAWIWLHFNLADSRGRAWIEDLAPLPESARELLLDTDDHLRLIAEDDTLMGVFADFRREFDHDTHDLARLKFALHRRTLITGRRQALQSVDEVRRMLRAGATFESGEALLERLFDHFAAQVALMTRDLAQQLEVIEDRVVDDAVEPEDIRVGHLRRTALRLARQVGALRLHFAALVDNPERELPEDVFAMTERVALRLASTGRDIEAIQERARIIQEEATAKSAAHMNRQLQTLSVLTALFMPATLVTGLFGMNTHGLPFGASDTGFWWAFFVAVCGSGGVYLVLRSIGIIR
ncbi:MAG: cobalt transporter [Siculibacillus sp.]|nr:cobalt transporter [Siculibacillus sp.]